MSVMKLGLTSALKEESKVKSSEQKSQPPRTLTRMAWRQFKRNPGALVGLGLLISFVLIAVFADILAPHDPNEIQAAMRRSGFSSESWLGRDELGRDILSRILIGSRVALGVAAFSVGIGIVVGTVLGLIAGYVGGKADTFLSFLNDFMLSFPTLLLAIIIVAALGPGLRNTAIAIGVSTIPIYARVVRGSTITISRFEYVEAASAIGAGPIRVVARHIVPNVLTPVVVISTLQLARSILYEASLSFLGLGAQPPDPSWGGMASTGRRFLQSEPHIVLVPSIAIMLVVLAFNLFGDGLRDALDPRLQTND